MSEPEPEIELYPSERNQAMILLANLQSKYGNKPNTKENLESFTREAESRFAEEIGLVVEIGMEYVQDNRGDMVMSPVISMMSRVGGDQGIDFDRMSRETQWGYLDGVTGRITEDGVWREPKKNL